MNARNRRPALMLVPTCLALLCAGCDDTVTDADLDKWTHNERGLARITEVVANPQQPIDTRIRALERVVQKGHSREVRSMIDGIKDAEDRTTVVRGLIAKMLAYIEAKDQKYELDAKDTLLPLARYVPDAEFEPIRQKVAAWAFAGIDWNTAPEAVQQLFENKISTGQLTDLGRHGWEGAAIVLSHGFAVDKMLELLNATKDPQAIALMVKGLKAHHKRVGPALHHLDALRKARSAEAAAYLIDLYGDENVDPDLRNEAYNSAAEMITYPEIKKAPEQVVEALFKTMDGKAPEDRWTGATNVMLLTGITHLERILGKLLDDKVYGDTEAPPEKSIQDLCMDIYDQGNASKAAPLFKKRLNDPNRIIRTVSVACLKLNRIYDAAVDLEPLTAPIKKKVPVPGEDVALDDFLGTGRTLGGLAQNAIEGLAMLQAFEKQAKEQSLPVPHVYNKTFIITMELELLGEVYTKTVEERYASFLEQFKACPESYDATTGKPNPAAKCPEKPAAPAPAPGAPAPGAPAPGAPAPGAPAPPP